jgi:WD40 repeat protein
MFSPDGRTLVSHSGDGLRFLDVASGKPLKKWGPKGNVNDVTFAPDGRALVVGQYQTVTVWDMARRSLSRTMKGESSAIAVSSDGRLVAGAAGDTVHLWNLQTGASLWTQPARHVRNIAFSPDGRVLAAATWLGEKVLAWDADTGQAVATIDDPGKPLTVAFAKDGLLLSGDEDGVIRAWDLRSRTASATSAPAQ